MEVFPPKFVLYSFLLDFWNFLFVPLAQHFAPAETNLLCILHIIFPHVLFKIQGHISRQVISDSSQLHCQGLKALKSAPNFLKPGCGRILWLGNFTLVSAFPVNSNIQVIVIVAFSYCH